jgi:predicted negative regulator of RcsB-dependent stress response
MNPPKGYRSKAPSRAEAVMEWFEFHTREAMWLAIALVVAAGGFWFYQKSQAAQARNASAALQDAEQALQSQNLPLGQSDLERLVKRYPDTEPGKVGIMLLAQVHYQKGEYQAGVDALQPFTSGDDPYFTAGALSLAGAGLEQLHKYAEAADSYQKAAAKSKYDSDKSVNLSSAARNLVLAGKVDEAKAIYQQLASDPQGVAAAEARVRLGEMEAKPAS